MGAAAGAGTRLCSHVLGCSGNQLDGAALLPGMLFGVRLQASELFAQIQRGEVYNCSSFCLHILNKHPQTDTWKDT